MRRVAIVVTLAVGGLIAAYGALILLDAMARAERRSSQALAVPAGGGFSLDVGSGDVTVQATDGPARLELREEQGLLGRSELRVTREPGGGMRVATDCGFPDSLLSCGGSVRALVPAGTPVVVDSGSGTVALRGLRAGAEADTGSGSVRLDGVSGPEVRVDTGSGEITGSGVAAGRLRATTGSGSVRLAATTAPDDLFVDTGSGSVELTLPDEVYDVGTRTGSGSQEVTVRADAASPRRLRVETGSGDVTVRPSP